MPGYLDRHRAARLMQEQGLSALVLAQPESITYATGAFPGVAHSRVYVLQALSGG